MKNLVFLFILCFCFLHIALQGQGRIEVEGIDTAQVTLNSVSFNDPTILNFNSGSLGTNFSQYRLRNQEDAFRLDIKSNFYADTDNIFIITPNNFRIANLAGNGIENLGVNSFGSLVRLAAQSKEISFPAQALNNDPANSIISQDRNGLRWQNNVASSAFLALKGPMDWDQTSNITISIYFYPRTSTPGTVQFFARHADFNIGDDVSVDAQATLSNMVSLTGVNDLHKATISFSASQLADEFWKIAIQRNSSGSSGPSYPDDVIVMNVTLGYKSTL